jgi:hypothetical protein
MNPSVVRATNAAHKPRRRMPTLLRPWGDQM